MLIRLIKAVSNRLTQVQEFVINVDKDLISLAKAYKGLLTAMRKQDERIAVLEGIMLKEAKMVKSNSLMN